jgi:hypothetical protein
MDPHESSSLPGTGLPRLTIQDVCTPTTTVCLHVSYNNNAEVDAQATSYDCQSAVGSTYHHEAALAVTSWWRPMQTTWPHI